MTDLTNTQKENIENALNAHEFLVRFLSKFDSAKRGGIHDFMEISLFNMINLAINNIDNYLSTGHKNVSANEIISIVAGSYQKILDNIKRNLEQLKQVDLK